MRCKHVSHYDAKVTRMLSCFWKCSARNGALVFSIADPCFWNSYRKDESIKRFDYWRSHAVTAPFRITSDPKALPTPTTYFHRPLSEYLSSVRQAGFQVEELVEPKPPIGAPKSYLHIVLLYFLDLWYFASGKRLSGNLKPETRCPDSDVLSIAPGQVRI